VTVLTPSLRPHLAGLAVMAVAAPATLAAVVGLNGLAKPPPEPDAAREVTFEVEPPPPPPPPPERPAPPRRRTSRTPDHPALAPPPSLGPALSGVQLDLAGPSVADLGGASDSVLGDLDQVVHTEATVDTRPTPRATTPIDVPAVARAKNLSGRVVLNVLVGADGSVREVRVLEADPPGVFDDAAVRAVRTWRFEPATYEGRAVEVWAALPIEFQP